MTKRNTLRIGSLLIASLAVLFIGQTTAFSQTSPSMLGLHIFQRSGGPEDNQILNWPANVPVQLHGVNRSSWEYQCFDPTAPPGVYYDGTANQAEINTMKTWNINTVRVVLNEDCWLGLHGLPLPTGSQADMTNYRNQVISYVNLLTSNNMAVIINLHFSGDGVHQAQDQEPMANRAHSNDFWLSIATTFGTGDLNNPKSSVMFELYNEPHDITWDCWKYGGCSVQGTQPGDGTFVVAGMQEMTNAIRGPGNAMNIVISTGLDWGSDLSSWVAYRPGDPASNTAGWHSYGDGLSCQTQACWDTTLVSVLAVAPIIATEIGNGNGTTITCAHNYIDPLMNWLDTHNMQGYTAWVWGPYGCPADPALITNWNGSPSQTYGQGYHDHLLTRP